MSDLPRVAHVEDANKPAGDVTRRTLITGVAATAVAATVVTADMPANAQIASAVPTEDMILFILLSSALTGISETKLATDIGPSPKSNKEELKKIRRAEFQKFINELKPGQLADVGAGSDPVGVKRIYFDWVNARHPAQLKNLLRIAKESVGAPDRRQAIADKVQSSGDKFLARSIVLMWYLGGWYDPKKLEEDRGHGPPPDFQVISPEAYTQGWALKIARAHPMGFSQLPFGYWTRPPAELVDYIG
ncbi:hypothetical protein [Bradyrhizobium sp. Mp27]|uniref:hypothetical protein n=1 Tax=Bradyrhizobium sp. Mp27 TaxID=3042157 RepID=UPI00248AF9E1|nr:hypothetical protein [Bradyrhizobium sp. Mp27]MDI2076636.1 hypothetical protein [Bradyrhizobium sp. Mp27]